MACMFTMMNRARLAVGLQGVGIAERATQQALAYARERKQGAAGAIIAYPDVKRMLLTMRTLTGAARAICYATGIAIDRSHARQNRRRAQERARARLFADACRQRPFRPTSARKWRPLAFRCTGAWATSRKPARRSTIGTRASPRSTKAQTESRRSTS